MPPYPGYYSDEEPPPPRRHSRSQRPQYPQSNSYHVNRDQYAQQSRAQGRPANINIYNDMYQEGPNQDAREYAMPDPNIRGRSRSRSNWAEQGGYYPPQPGYPPAGYMGPPPPVNPYYGIPYQPHSASRSKSGSHSKERRYSDEAMRRRILDDYKREERDRESRERRAIEDAERARSAERREREEELKKWEEEKKEREAKVKREKDEALQKYEREQKEKQEKAKREREETIKQYEQEKRERAEKEKKAREEAVRKYEEEKKEKEEEEKRIWQEVEDKRKRKEQEAKEKKEKEDEEYRERMRKHLASIGYAPNQIEHMIQMENGTKKKVTESSNQIVSLPIHEKRPTYPLLRRTDIALETLEHFGLRWRYHETDSEFIVIEQEMTEKETNVLFRHTAKVREKEEKKREKNLLAIEDGGSKKKPEYQMVRRRSKSARRDKSPSGRERLARAVLGAD